MPIKVQFTKLENLYPLILNAKPKSEPLGFLVFDHSAKPDYKCSYFVANPISSRMSKPEGDKKKKSGIKDMNLSLHSQAPF